MNACEIVGGKLFAFFRFVAGVFKQLFHQTLIFVCFVKKSFLGHLINMLDRVDLM